MALFQLVQPHGEREPTINSVNPFVATKGTTDLRTKISQHGNHV